MVDFCSDSDDVYSFVHPYGDNVCRVKSLTILDRLANNAAELQNFTSSLALHANYAIKNFVSSENDDDYDSDFSRRPPKEKSMNINSILDKATGCAATLRSVADQLPETCLGQLNRDGDYYSSSDDDHSIQKVRRIRKNTFVEVQSEISVTSSSKESTRDDASITSYEGSSKNFSSDSNQKRRLTKLRRRKKQYLHRRAMERTATETDDDLSNFAYGPRLGVKNHIPSQELRSTDKPPADGISLSKAELDAEIVNGNQDYSQGGIESQTTFQVSMDSPDDPTMQNEQSSEIPPSSDCNSPKAYFARRPPKWESHEKLVNLPPNPVYSFLTSSHLGPVVTRSVGDFLELGDVLIRLNGEDVSGLESEIVSEIFKQMAGGSIQVTFLRRI